MQVEIKVLLLSRYDTLGASSRVRSYQYLPFLREHGVSVTVSPLFSNAYLQALYDKRTSWFEVIKSYSRRFFKLFTLYKYDVVLIEKELFPFLPAVVERLMSVFGMPYLVDYDDALFHRYDTHRSSWVRALLGKKIDTVMKRAAVVVAGNDYLAARAEQAGAKNVIIIPTVVDSEHYQPTLEMYPHDELTVGWIGTPKTSQYLQELLPVFAAIKKDYAVRFVAIGANSEDFKGTPVEVWPWTEETEVSLIQQFDIGIMPLKDSPWERGKCGYKLIQYMACGLPVIASPVGVNAEIVKPGINGLLANSQVEWENALTILLELDELPRTQLGMAGRRMIEETYSLQSQAPRLLAVIKEASAATK